MAEQHYDVLIIGAGAAGSTAATALAEQGKKVALVERDKLGGTCLNYGCDPTKTLLYIADLWYRAQHVEKFGLHIPAPTAQWAEVQAYVQQAIHDIRGGDNEEAIKGIQDKGIDLFRGEASFVSPEEVVVMEKQENSADAIERTLKASHILIATGDQTDIPALAGLQEAGFITNAQAISLPELPKRMAILGGGAIGMEFGQMFHRFGVEVTILEQGSLLSKEDCEAADALIKLLNAEGLKFEASVEVTEVHRASDGKHVKYQRSKNEEAELVVDELLVAIGRKPVLEQLHLHVAGVETTKKGINVDEYLRTNVSHIWAAGDVTGGYQFTHVASDQGLYLAHNMLAEHPQPYGEHVIPWVTYTNPPLAHVGKTEEELKEAGTTYKVGRMPFKALERAISQDETEGFVKLLVDEQGNILGSHILGSRADELIAPIVLAMQQGLPVEAIAKTIFPYPTYSDAVRQAAQAALTALTALTAFTL